MGLWREFSSSDRGGAGDGLRGAGNFLEYYEL